MEGRLIVKEATLRTASGEEVTHFEIYDVLPVDGRTLLHRRSDVGFRTREEADAWIATQGGGEGM